MSSRKGRSLKHGPLQALPIPQQPFDIVDIDLVVDMPVSSQGNKHILTMMDCLSGFPIAVPIKQKGALHVANALFDYLICNFGVPRILHSDHGTEFRNSLTAHLAKRLGT